MVVTRRRVAVEATEKKLKVFMVVRGLFKSRTGLE